MRKNQGEKDEDGKVDQRKGDMRRKGKNGKKRERSMNKRRGKGGCTAYEEEERKEDRRKRGGEEGDRADFLGQGAEKCDLVPGPGDISSTQLIDF